jgi:hypothetical protein
MMRFNLVHSLPSLPKQWPVERLSPASLYLANHPQVDDPRDRQIHLMALGAPHYPRCYPQLRVGQ